MIGRQDRWQEDLFVAGPLRDLIPGDHILRRVDRILDLSWLRAEVSECYSERMGRSSIDPEAAVRLMLAGLFHGIVHDRKLMREAQVNLAIRWFAGFQLHDQLPSHSSLTRIRHRWGKDRFRRIFLKSVEACGRRGLISGETVHVDATLIRADVSWESLIERHVEETLSENVDSPVAPDGRDNDEPRSRPSKKKKKKKYSTTDPDATLSTSCKRERMTPCFKQHTAVDDSVGIVVDVEVTTGEASEGCQLLEQLDRIEAQTGYKFKSLTGDSGYAHPANYAGLEERGTQAIIPPQREPKSVKRIPKRRFRYDALHQVVRCPAGKKLYKSCESKNGSVYRARTANCRACHLRSRCISPSTSARTIHIGHHYEALQRARRHRLRWGNVEHGLYNRHRWRAEGAHGEAKTRHGLARAIRRGLENVAIQAYLTAAVMNLKRLALLLRLIAGAVRAFAHPPTEKTGQASFKPWAAYQFDVVVATA